MNIQDKARAACVAYAIATQAFKTSYAAACEAYNEAAADDAPNYNAVLIAATAARANAKAIYEKACVDYTKACADFDKGRV